MTRQATLRIGLASAFALAVTACATVNSVQDAPLDAGATQKFDAPFDTVKFATLDAIRDLRIEPASTEDLPQGFTILISRTPHGVSWGEVGRIIVEHSSAPPTTVHIHYQRRFAFQNAGQGDRFARTLFGKIALSLATHGNH